MLNCFVTKAKERKRGNRFVPRLSRIGGILATVAFVSAGFCQDISGDENVDVSSETIEEIVVRGEKSLIQLRLELNRAEDKAFDLFNSLNSNDEYDIHCYMEAPTGSRIKRRVCRANFVVDATTNVAKAFQLGLPSNSDWAAVQLKYKHLQEEMEALVVERPEFFDALSEFSEAKKALESENQRRCEGRAIVCEK